MYGAMFRNSLGRRIIDTEEFTYYAKASGTARTLQIIGTSPDYQGGWIQAGYYGVPSKDPMSVFYRTFWAATSLTHVGETDVNGRKQTWRPNPRWDVDNLCFWQPGANGIYWMDDFHFTNDWTVFRGSGVFTAGTSFWATGPSATPPNWITTTTTRQNITGGVGMVLRNAANQITFDSRQDLLSVEYAQIITQAQMADVLDNNATITITLPRSLPGCYIHSPVWKSFRRVSEFLNVRTDVYLPIIRQTGNATLTISRYTVPKNGSNVWSANPEDIYSQAWDGAPGVGDEQAHYFDTPLFVSAGIL